mgnify:FL=1
MSPFFIFHFSVFHYCMCGITGFIGKGGADDLRRMNNTLIRRGPDAEGYFSDDAARAHIAVRRLAIIDVAGGAQPIANEDGTVVVLNGEIYNYRDLRRRMAARHVFKTASDTEVIAHLYEEKGDSLAEELEGMFAFALWDRRAGKIIIARDRFGEKPLYYAVWNGTFVFGSEIKALLAHPDARRELDRESLLQYLQYECVPAPRTIFSGINKLPAGHILTFQNGEIKLRRYWDIESAAKNVVPPTDAREAAERLDQLLSRAVQKMLMSDVPLGVFLSGGIDSSTVAYYAQKHTVNKIKTFSIGFQESSFDESSYAGRVAVLLDTDHTAALFSECHLRDLLPSLYEYLDEPLADPSLLPTALLSRITRRRVTVALGGDGADELFFGYPTFQAEKIFALYRRIPRVLRERLIRPLIDRLPASSRYLAPDYRLKRFLRGADESPEARHAAWIGAFTPQDLASLLIWKPAWKPGFHMETRFPSGQTRDTLSRAGQFYLSHYLEGDILAKVDRASMFYGLETRAPFLDPALAAFVYSLPSAYKLRGLQTKYLLKKLMRPRLGRDITDRAKHGFQPPIARWLRQELSGLLREHLNPDTLGRDGLFDPGYVARLIHLHQTGKADHRKELWTLLVFQIWRSRWYT